MSALLYTTQEKAIYGNRSNRETSREARPSRQAKRPAHTVFAFPKQRKDPLADTRYMRDSAARFDQVIDVSDADRALAFANIQKAGVLQREPVGDRLVSVPARTRLVPRLVLCSQHAKLRLSWRLTALRPSSSALTVQLPRRGPDGMRQAWRGGSTPR
jgi:hypothetical protein